MSSPTHVLSKSRFVAGLQCTKRLYLETHHRDLATPPGPALERIFASGHTVGELAQQRFPGGILIDANYTETQRALVDTRKAIESGVPVLFEPAFVHQGVLVRVDVLQKRPDGRWDLIEVKSTTGVSDTHIADVAIQRYTCEGAGIDVASCSVMHLNRECRFPDLSNLFVLEDVTVRAENAWPDVGPLVTEFAQILARAQAPDVPIGSHCTRPYECPFKAHCWRAVHEPSVFTIPRLDRDKVDRLVREGITSVSGLPDSFPLSTNQRRYVDLIKRDEPYIDRQAIADSLACLEFPLQFLDFETMAEPIPRLDGLGPYSMYPFQYSLHILTQDGDLEHREYLHPDASDSRSPLARRLLLDIGATGSIVAYNAGFEQRVIETLVTCVPDAAKALRALLPRFFDLLPIFRTSYLHPAFAGSASIKKVLPVLVPDLNYDNLSVASGDVAQVVWWEMITTEEEPERRRRVESLTQYCALDTLAMVRIYQALTAEISRNDPHTRSQDEGARG